MTQEYVQYDIVVEGIGPFTFYGPVKDGLTQVTSIVYGNDDVARMAGEEVIRKHLPGGIASQVQIGGIGGFRGPETPYHVVTVTALTGVSYNTLANLSDEDAAQLFERLSYWQSIAGFGNVDDAADRMGRAVYWARVNRMVDELVEAKKSGEFDNEEEAREWFDNALDTATIYTSDNYSVVRWSENSDAYVSEMGEAPVEDNEIKWDALAWFALREDILAKLPDDFFDGFDDDDDDEEEDLPDLEGYEVGVKVLYYGRIGTIVALDEDDIELPIRVEFQDDTSQWTHPDFLTIVEDSDNIDIEAGE